MKKNIKYLLLLFISMFIGIESISAASISVNPSSVKVGDAFTVSFSDVPADANDYKLDYDENYIELLDQNGSMPGNILATSGSPTFRVKSSLSLNQNKIVAIKIIKVDDGNPEIASTNLTIKANKTATTTQAPATTTISNKSNNSNIKTLVVKGDDDSDVVLSPVFSSSVYEYTASVPGTISKVNIEAVLEDAKANLVISDNANKELVEGENNKITLTVTAEDGSQKAYVINIKRSALDGDALLTDLKIKEYENFKFKTDKFKYTVIIDEDVTSLSISYIINSEKTIVDITGNEKLKDGSIVRILVTAEDGTKKEYTLNISKIKKASTTTAKEEKNPIIIIILSLVAASLATSIVIVAIKKH